MGEHIRKVAWILFALLFVGVIAAMNNGILSTATNGNKQLSATLQTSDTASLELYNDSSVSGSQVLSAAKNPGSLSTTNLIVGVCTAASGNSSIYQYTAGAEVPASGSSPFSATNSKFEYTETVKNTADATINPSAQFHSYLIKNKNEAPCAILFVQNGVDVNSNMIGSDFTCAALG